MAAFERGRGFTQFRECRFSLVGWDGQLCRPHELWVDGGRREHRLAGQKSASQHGLRALAPVHPAEMPVNLAPAQRAFFRQQFEQAGLYRISRRSFFCGFLLSFFCSLLSDLVSLIGLLAQPGRQHDGQDGCQRIERGLGHFLGQFDLLNGQDRQRVKQVKDGFCLGYGALGDQLQHHPLGGLPAKGHGDKLTHANPSTQFFGQVVIKDACDR